MAKKRKEIVQHDNTPLIQESMNAMAYEEIRKNKDSFGKHFCFSGEKDSRKIILNPENTYFKITKIQVCPHSQEITGAFYFNPITITCKINISEISSRTEFIEALNNESFQHYEKIIDANQVINNGEPAHSIEFSFTGNESFGCDVYVYYTTFDKRVDLKNPYEEFSDHIKLKDNIKILFSGPFGQGKTTFLGDFFEKNEIKYEVFKLYPVNYAVSHNDDIFKYIKAEVLFQLMEKDVEFDKLEFNYSEATHSYFSKNADKIISPLLSLLPKIGETAAKVFDKVYELAQALKKHKEELDIDDKKDALDYIHDLYAKEGSIFEDNFYTQLIRQLLEQHKLKHKKENVLIIDDIDRMDPDHIFRIFNVFSANFDSSEYRIGLSNKFGFDKIILVCDYSNIKNIFMHRYGLKTDFSSYINKYFSREPFMYNNNSAINTLIKEIGNRPASNYSPIWILTQILGDLLITNNLTLREIIKFNKLDLSLLTHGLPREKMGIVNITRGETLSKYKNFKFIYFLILHYLCKIGDIDLIIHKLRNCKELIFYDQRSGKYGSTNDLAQIGLIPLATDNVEQEQMYYYTYNSELYSFKAKEDRTISGLDFYMVEECWNRNKSPARFNEKDFYEILILNALKYKETGGLGGI